MAHLCTALLLFFVIVTVVHMMLISQTGPLFIIYMFNRPHIQCDILDPGYIFLLLLFNHTTISSIIIARNSYLFFLRTRVAFVATMYWD